VGHRGDPEIISQILIPGVDQGALPHPGGGVAGPGPALIPDLDLVVALGPALQLQGRLAPEITLHEPKVALATNGGSGALFCDVMALGKEPV
jgi:hypothetical protein